MKRGNDTAKCKFCEAELTGKRCESGSNPETGDIYYCGSEECPACTFCQGDKEVTPDMIAVAKEIRANRERR